mgnify:CR=1 FL=1
MAVWRHRFLSPLDAFSWAFFLRSSWASCCYSLSSFPCSFIACFVWVWWLEAMPEENDITFPFQCGMKKRLMFSIWTLGWARAQRMRRNDLDIKLIFEPIKWLHSKENKLSLISSHIVDCEYPLNLIAKIFSFLIHGAWDDRDVKNKKDANYAKRKIYLKVERQLWRRARNFNLMSRM